MISYCWLGVRDGPQLQDWIESSKLRCDIGRPGAWPNILSIVATSCATPVILGRALGQVSKDWTAAGLATT